MNTAAERDYLLGTDEEELRRLQAQHDTWHPETADLWERADFSAGQVILDLGCGPGFTSLELAERVGAEGTFWRLMGRRSSRIFSGIALRQPACSKSRSP